MSLEDVYKLAKSDPGIFFTPDMISFFVNLKKIDLPGWVRERAKLKTFIPIGELESEMKKIANTPERSPDIIPEETPPEIKDKALDILKNKNPIDYIVQSCQKFALGAEMPIRVLIACISCQDIRQSAGLHPKLSGDSGTGKSWVVYNFANHLPSEMVSAGSISNMAVFYHQDGNKIFRIMDDYRAGNESLDTIIKQTSTKFHSPYIHKTVKKMDGALVPSTMQIGSEQTWAITSVNSSQDIQVLNRQVPINVEDSEDLTKDVNAYTIHRYGNGDVNYDEDIESVQVCREMWRILRAEGDINIRVPFAGYIEWKINKSRRDPSIFMDMLISITAMNRYQRVKDENGFYLSTEEDFNQAKEIYSDKDVTEELIRKLTKAERRFAEVLKNHPDGLQATEAAALLNVTPARLSQLAHGERGSGGLCQKLSGFSAEKTAISELKEDGTRITTQKMLYKLNRYHPVGSVNNIVELHLHDDEDVIEESYDNDMSNEWE